MIDWGKYPTIPLSKHVRFDEDPNTYNYSTELNYTVGGDSLVDRFATAEKGKTVMKICNALTGCKQPHSVCAGRCARQLRSQWSVSGSGWPPRWKAAKPPRRRVRQ